MTEEEKENWRSAHYRMNDEGLHYCFVYYSNFDEIKDEEFHKLRKNYLDVAESLKAYVNEKCKIAEEDEDDI